MEYKPEISQLNRTLLINVAQDRQNSIPQVAKALSSEQRLRILDYLQTKIANVSEIAKALGMPRPTTNQHLDVLADAGLIRFEIKPAKRGVQKLCFRLYDIVVMHIPTTLESSAPTNLVIEMPVGKYMAHQVSPTCGLASKTSLIGQFDDLASFYEPEGVLAQLIWLGQGFLEYRFPYRHEDGRYPNNLQISMEICSEASPHHPDWPSDIFLEINEILIGTWKSPGDFGGERGKLTPTWWDEWNTQYGLLKTWRVDQNGSSIDGRLISDISIADLNLNQQPYIQMKIGVKPDAKHVGGLNIFGKEFGNHAQDIILTLNY